MFMIRRMKKIFVAYVIVYEPLLSYLNFPAVVERVTEEMADRNAANLDTLNSIREKLDQFHKQLLNLSDSLNDAVKNIARATEANNMNQKLLEDYKVHSRTHADTVPHNTRSLRARIKT